MWQTQFAVYLGEEIEEGFFGFVAENNFFLVLEAKTGLEKESGRQALTTIKQELINQKIDNLVKLENFINNQIKQCNLPTSVTLAVGYVTDKIVYLKTIGEGKIFIRRKNNFEKIIDGNQTASGYIEAGDFFIFTTDRFVQLFMSEIELRTIFDHKTPHQIVEDLAPQMKTGDDQGTIALFVQFINPANLHQEREKEEIIVSQPLLIEKGKNFFNNLYQQFNQSRLRTDKKRSLTLVMVVILILILVWSVGLGLIRRKESQLNQQISRSRELISQKLDQAEEVAFLNLSRSQALISEAREEFSNLKKSVGNKKKVEITAIEKLIAEKENKIVKKEEKKAEEAFNLTVDNKNAQGSALYLDGDNLVVLDNKQGNIYQLSLSKKSIEKVSSSEIKSAQLIANYQDNIFFYVGSKGIYRAELSSKPKLIIEKDDDWGKIVDLWVYNSNLYLIDLGKDEIYKYLAGEDAYSAKSGYIKSGEGVDLGGANSLAIDSSVYIGFEDYGVKYAAGVRDDFKTTFPEEGVKMVKIYTNKDLEKVYGWDKSNGAVYVLGKNGSYERQIKSSILTKGSDLVVFENSAYIVVKEKIYKVSLD